MILLILVLSAYPIYALVIYNISKSPDDLSLFPTSGIWICENSDFSITIDLTNVENDGNLGDDMVATIDIDGNDFYLDHYVSSGHGTILAPVAAQEILTFSSGKTSQYFIHFSSSKFRFEDDGFYLLDIYVYENNTFSALKNDMDLHFLKQSAEKEDTL